jgi:hypothetical protein
MEYLQLLGILLFLIYFNVLSCISYSIVGKIAHRFHSIPGKQHSSAPREIEGNAAARQVHHHNPQGAHARVRREVRLGVISVLRE